MRDTVNSRAVRPALILVILLSLVFVGCDEFSLHDRFYRFDLPPTPGDFTADAVGTNTIGLSWSYDTPSVDGFRIMRSDDGGNTFTEIVTENDLGASARSYDDGDGLNSATTYVYRMYAVDGDYLSEPTPEVSATTK